MFSESKRYLQHVGNSLEKVPVVVFFLAAVKDPPKMKALLEQVMDKVPESVRRALQSIKAKATSVAEFLDEVVKKYHVVKAASTVISAAVFAFIWFNVTEIRWNVPELVRGFLGGYSWVELLHSLPESAVGLLIGMILPGIPGGLIWNALLPATIALRLAWLVHERYAEHKPGRIEINWGRLGGYPELAPEVIPV